MALNIVEGKVWNAQLGSVPPPDASCNCEFEIGLRRPCFVLKQTAPHFFVIVPITRGDRQDIANIVLLQPADGCVALVSSALCGSIRTVGRSRFENRRGALAANKVAAIKLVVQGLFV